MKHQITKELLLFLMLCDLDFAAVGLRFPANPLQVKTQSKKATQTGLMNLL